MTNRSTAPLLVDDKPQPDQPIRDVALVPAESANLVLMFERLAKDPSVDVEKLQRLIDMQKDILRHQAEAQFWDAFARMQGDLPTITEDGQIKVGEVIRSRYSTNEAIQEAIRPILQRHGFSLSFRNTTNDKGRVCVTGILAHTAGHKERDTFESDPDSGGQMNSIQRIGSTRSYGQRYTTIALLNIVSRARQDRDDDGQKSGRPTAPDGYDGWKDHLSAAAVKGTKALEAAWECSDGPFKTYMANHDREAQKALKATAAAVRGGAR